MRLRERAGRADGALVQDQVTVITARCFIRLPPLEYFICSRRVEEMPKCRSQGAVITHCVPCIALLHHFWWQLKVSLTLTGCDSICCFIKAHVRPIICLFCVSFSIKYHHNLFLVLRKTNCVCLSLFLTSHCLSSAHGLHSLSLAGNRHSFFFFPLPI